MCLWAHGLESINNSARTPRLPPIPHRCIQSVTSVQCPYCGKMVPQHTYCCGRVVQVPQVKQRPVLGDRESLSKLSKETLLELLTGLQ